VFCSTRSGPDDARTEALRALGRRCYDLFAGAVGKIELAGLLRCGDVDAAAQTSWAATHGVVTLLITQPNFGWASRETLLPMMLDSVFYGLVRG
jgi:hypothetical protein